MNEFTEHLRSVVANAKPKKELIGYNSYCQKFIDWLQ